MIESLLYRNDQIKPHLASTGKGEDSFHFALERREGGVICPIVMEGTLDGIEMNSGIECGGRPEFPVIRLYQGLTPGTVWELQRMVYKSHDLLHEGKIGLDAIVRYMDRKITKPGAIEVPLINVEDCNWLAGYKWTPGRIDNRS